jgi:hypothetical protein
VQYPVGYQYENLISQGLSTIGKRIWHPVTSERGKMTAQAFPGTRHSTGRRLLERRIIATTVIKLIMSASLNRLRIRGTSLKKLDVSTSFIVAPHVMLYEKRCASRASDRWIEMPPKKKKL